MKKPYTPISKVLASIVLPVSCLLLSMPLHAQVGECLTVEANACAGGTAFGDLQATMETDFQMAVAGTNAGMYNTFAVLEGQTYEWSMCSEDGATIPTGADTELTLRNNMGEFLCFSDDVCGEEVLQAKIQWTATYTGEVRVQVNEWHCESNTGSHTMAWRCVSCGSIGINEKAPVLAISAWPNPAQDRLNLTFGGTQTGRVQYMVVDAVGREVLQGMSMSTPESVLQLDISALASGQYMVRGTMDSVHGTQIFVKH